MASMKEFAMLANIEFKPQIIIQAHFDSDMSFHFRYSNALCSIQYNKHSREWLDLLHAHFKQSPDIHCPFPQCILFIPDLEQRVKAMDKQVHANNLFCNRIWHRNIGLTFQVEYLINRSSLHCTDHFTTNSTTVKF